MFAGYLMGGFECSTHRNYQKRRIDAIAASRHDRFAERDYERLSRFGMRTARDGVRWHLIEKKPYFYDFSSLENQAAAARRTGIQIVWDFFHYGFPDDLDIFSAEFVKRFTAFSAATAEFLKNKTERTLFICPTNENSFFAWVSAEIGAFYPFERHRADELKRQLVRAAIAATDAIRALFPDTRFVQCDPAIHIAPPKNATAEQMQAAENFRRAQFQALDMQCGKIAPELGGAPGYLDIIGVNYYPYNQWRVPSNRRILLGNRDYRPFSEILREFHDRYDKPLIIAETGTEDAARPDWFRYVWQQTEIAKAAGVPVHGFCLYPVVNHPGWDDDRHCHNGLWDYADETGEREIYQPLADEIRALDRARAGAVGI